MGLIMATHERLRELSGIHGITLNTLKYRINFKKMSEHEAVTIPIRRRAGDGYETFAMVANKFHTISLRS